MINKFKSWLSKERIGRTEINTSQDWLPTNGLLLTYWIIQGSLLCLVALSIIKLGWTVPITKDNNLLNSDYVQTPLWCAEDMIEFFKPNGTILDPCRGENKVFHNLLQCDFNEIKENSNFFDNHNHYNWIIGNPPYSIFNKWINHSYNIADNIVYLLPTFKVFNALSLMRLYLTKGHIKHIRLYDTKNNIDWARSRPICAVHFKPNYFGDTSYSTLKLWLVRRFNQQHKRQTLRRFVFFYS